MVKGGANPPSVDARRRIISGEEFAFPCRSDTPIAVPGDQSVPRAGVAISSVGSPTATAGVGTVRGASAENTSCPSGFSDRSGVWMVLRRSCEARRWNHEPRCESVALEGTRSPGDEFRDAEALLVSGVIAIDARKRQRYYPERRYASATLRSRKDGRSRAPATPVVTLSLSRKSRGHLSQRSDLHPAPSHVDSITFLDRTLAKYRGLQMH